MRAPTVREGVAAADERNVDTHRRARLADFSRTATNARHSASPEQAKGETGSHGDRTR